MKTRHEKEAVLMVWAHGKQGNDLSLHVDDTHDTDPQVRFNALNAWASDVESTARGIRALAESIKDEKDVNIEANNNCIIIYGLSSEARIRAIAAAAVHDMLIEEDFGPDEKEDQEEG